MSILTMGKGLIGAISELYGINLFIWKRNLERQCLEISLDIYGELRKRSPKRILVVGPGISPYMFQLANQIENCSFIALDVNKNCLDLTRSVIGIKKPSEIVERLSNKYKISEDVKPQIKNFLETHIEAARQMMTDALLWPVKDLEKLYERLEFVHGDISSLPYHNLDAILAFNVIQYLGPRQVYRAFHSIKDALTEGGFFVLSANMEKLYSGYITFSKKNKYHMLFEYLKEKDGVSFFEASTLAFKKMIPYNLKWEVKKGKRYWCVFGEKT